MRYTVKVQAEDEVIFNMEMTRGEHDAISRFIRLYDAEVRDSDIKYAPSITMERKDNT